jgi:hypothetical protein
MGNLHKYLDFEKILKRTIFSFLRKFAPVQAFYMRARIVSRCCGGNGGGPLGQEVATFCPAIGTPWGQDDAAMPQVLEK